MKEKFIGEALSFRVVWDEDEGVTFSWYDFEKITIAIYTNKYRPVIVGTVCGGVTVLSESTIQVHLSADDVKRVGTGRLTMEILFDHQDDMTDKVQPVDMGIVIVDTVIGKGVSCG